MIAQVPGGYLGGPSHPQVDLTFRDPEIPPPNHFGMLLWTDHFTLLVKRSSESMFRVGEKYEIA